MGFKLNKKYCVISLSNSFNFLEGIKFLKTNPQTTKKIGCKQLPIIRSENCSLPKRKTFAKQHINVEHTAEKAATKPGENLS